LEFLESSSKDFKEKISYLRVGDFFATKQFQSNVEIASTYARTPAGTK
jgi:hypothetical protein